MKQNALVKFCKSPVAKGIAVGLLSLTVTQANAVNFDLGDFEISFDSTFSYGESWRVENRNWNDNIGKSNNLNNNLDWQMYDYSSSQIWDLPGSYSTNGDLGNLNFNSGEAFSRVFKGSHELDVRYDNFGFFARGLYFYDFELMGGGRPYSNPLDGSEYDPCDDDDAKEEVCADVRLLDAFFYADFDIGDTPVSVRVGEQVISWGESTLISHGISEINPVDIARLRAPGAELKEAFIPFGAVWTSFGVTENFNIEAYYQYRWENSILPAPGSYFSTNDFAGSGGYANNIQLGFGSAPDLNLDTLYGMLQQAGELARSGDGATAGNMLVGLSRAVTLRAQGYGDSAFDSDGNLVGNVEPEDGGQYGLRFSYFMPELNDTELSLYYMNYHSRRPLISGVTADYTNIAQDVAMVANPEFAMDDVTKLGVFSKAQLFFPEDIKLYGLSFNTTVGLTSVAGEVSYRQDEPLQIDDVELLFAAVPQQLANAGLAPFLDGISQMKKPDGSEFQQGEAAKGWIESDTLQAQVTLTHLFGPTFGASQFTGLVEIGGINIMDMPDEDVLRLNGPGGSRSGTSTLDNPYIGPLFGGTETNMFPTEFAWGYRALAKLDYNDVFAGVNVSPRVVFSHDVKGTTPDPLFLFVEDRKSVAFTVGFDYQSRWSADISYNAFFGGAGTINQIEDRDFVSFNVKYSI
ncbi:DUF1302 domain-containing protein [Thalassotalea mangrovi]|uniref:DUF1302 domain-containing protein n=1 Tax=Thalassotalea mangrovi TaxID=2572245 RepID=A0A4U1B5V5_9GAMM|nr:DUF1302 domain-containing protein [Thalassotalea mangrovi]TKB45869.1 DUF1302 domain-containing protein [Thalassotalea mangrovi]